MRPITTQLTTEQKSQVAALLAALLAESAAAPLVVPAKKTPFIERAKALGITLRQAQAVANKAMAQFARRAERAQAKLDRAAAAKRKYHQDFRAAVSKLAGSQQLLMQAASRAEIKAALKAAGLHPTAAEVTRAGQMLLQMQVKTAYEQRYRTCVNGTVSASIAGQAGVTQAKYLDWNLYKGAVRRPARIVDTQLVLRADYWDRVSKTGLARLAYILVLDAEPARRRAADGIRVFSATWIEQPLASSNAVRSAQGYIATCGTRHASGPTADDAVSSLRFTLAAIAAVAARATAKTATVTAAAAA